MKPHIGSEVNLLSSYLPWSTTDHLFQVYYKVLQLFLLQSAMVCYYKVRQLFYYKVRQVLLQSATVITKCDSFITKCDRYYKVRRLLQSATLQHSLAFTGRLLSQGVPFLGFRYIIGKGFKVEVNERVQKSINKEWKGLQLKCFETIYLFAISFSFIMFIKRYLKNDMREDSLYIWRFIFIGKACWRGNIFQWRVYSIWKRYRSGKNGIQLGKGLDYGPAWEFLAMVREYRPVPQILTLFQTKNCLFSHPFSELASKIDNHSRVWPLRNYVIIT